ncbi:MAG: rubrerythrin family protein [Tenericutes bacterium HGW-Tenericutes-1]|jgi:VIT1/CCC1 family predicted Fe2+/Mn2+ transporter|nr:MAG: rubrerythrin family protein [Tenericutes bacterium HGW-Tenericutes-1]
MKEYPAHIKKQIKAMQRDELTGYYVYKAIAKRMKNSENKSILERIAQQEKNHYDIWTSYLGELGSTYKIKVFIYKILNFLLGFTFTLKLMEMGEDKSKKFYESIGEYIDEAASIALEEDSHEIELIEMLDEERLNYVGSMVLGLNDALVELTGTLAGLTFALSDPLLISLSGLITGIAASLSMASSEYLSAKADNLPNAKKSAIYTGIAYIITVMLLVLPYLLIANKYISLSVMLGVVVLIILFFNYYISVAKSIPFKKRFWQMIFISFGVAIISFGIGTVIKIFLGVDA